ncbi:MAG: YggS family pyridoxal phosphate-dependent enzyme [Moraxella sp.]|nr:YggS family pyridoxal phosphate-dependent enzyme [Moraxella sp.]
MIDELVNNYKQIKQNIAVYNADHGGNTALLCVSKTKPSEMIRTLYGAGQRDFGENYLQEALGKMEELSDLSITWHYIGHIQRNKTRDIAKHFDWVQTVERDIIAKRLHEQRPAELPPLNVLIELNIDNEDSKSGCMIDELDGLIECIMSYDRLCLRGLMIIPSKDGTDAFARTKAVFDDIKTRFGLPMWDTLSMGMSGDMEQAIAGGSTMVRVGTAIFGVRM